MDIGNDKFTSALLCAMKFFTKSKKVVHGNKYNILAVIEKNGNILSTGINRMKKTHPQYFNGEFDRGIHAEFDAIRKLSRSALKGASIYVFRFSSTGLAMSRPCDHCMDLLMEKGLKKLIYVNEKSEIEVVRL